MQIPSSHFKSYPLEIKDNEDIKERIWHFIQEKNLKDSFIMVSHGSLKKVILKKQHLNNSEELEGEFELRGLFGVFRNHDFRLSCLLHSCKDGSKLNGELLSGTLVRGNVSIIFGRHSQRTSKAS